MNAVQIIGRLTSDVEIRRTQSGKAVATYSLAVKRPRSKDETDFHNVVTWEKGAEYLSQYGHKGDIVAVSGSLQSRKFTDKNGNNRIAWEIVADSVELLSGRKNSDGGNNTAQGQNGSYAQAEQPVQDFRQIDMDDANLPF